MKHIGILGHSADGAALCFLEMVREAGRRLGPHVHPEITLSILPMGPVLAAYENQDFESVHEYLLRTAGRLAASGCDFMVCPDNTAHLAFDVAKKPFPLPFLHLPLLVAETAKERGHTKVGVLGTKWTMEGSSYSRALSNVGLGMALSDEEDQRLIDHIIFGELCRGVLSDSSRDLMVSIIERLAVQGCDAVALACTEIPLLISADDSPLPILDSTRLLALASVDVALGKRRLPSRFL